MNFLTFRSYANPAVLSESYVCFQILRPLVPHVPSYCIHSRSFDHRRSPDPFRAAMAAAFF
ncbi:hypothetical protein AFERRID_20750 [Acidithiobacillus ferridurans]|uniref:Uncharacterized protein n=1 Tax=Acidithiobacillus ferridurans TaxID=1232575 RepID=A0A2Z6IMB0_ACIFI|nr:hypothetical protein AFERRID_20750 [Acidithiobacillus ferridurans]